MRDKFVSTTNVKALMEAVVGLDQRGAPEACLIVVEGKPGLGKTAAVNRLSVQHGWTYVRAKVEWTGYWMLKEICLALGLTPPRSYEEAFSQLVAAFSGELMQAARDERPYCLVVDEADHICRSKKLMETLRDFTDFVEVPVILVGMGAVSAALTRFEMIQSRVHRPVDFKPATLDDVRKMTVAQCEVFVGDDLVDLLHRESRGLLREVKEGLARIESWGKRNASSDNKPITVADMDGEVLMYDRKTGRAIKVRGA